MGKFSLCRAGAVFKGGSVAEQTKDPSGIDALLCAELREGRDCLVQLDPISMEKWAQAKTLEVWQAVLLHSYLNPDHLGFTPSDGLLNLQRLNLLAKLEVSRTPGATARSLPELLLFDNLIQAIKAIGSGQLAAVTQLVQGERSIVRLSDFHIWSVRFKLPVIGHWQAQAGNGCRSKWPWGCLETERLKVLEAVAKRYWRTAAEGGHYVPGDIRTASTTKDIAAWILQEYPWVGRQTSEAMAVILRPDGLPKGRHPES